MAWRSPVCRTLLLAEGVPVILRDIAEESGVDELEAAEALGRFCAWHMLVSEHDVYRLVNWDKRNAAALASLLWRARQAGRIEASLSGRQLEVVLTALEDAAVYRTSGAAAVGCWDCENITSGRCADHAKDGDRARACAELAAHLAATQVPGPGSPGDLQRPTDISGFRRRTSVAS